MLRCPFCQFENEDNTQFCGKCRADLRMVWSSIDNINIDSVTSKGNPAVGSFTAAFDDMDGTDRTPRFPSPGAPAAAPASPAIPVPQTPHDAQTQRTREGIAESDPRNNDPVTPRPQPADSPSDSTAHDGILSDDLIQPAVAVTMPVSAIQPSGAIPLAPPEMPNSARPKLLVLRGERVNMQYPIYEGKNFVGRTDDKPVDVDLENQEPPDRIWTSRQHAVISYDNGILAIEDLNSLNGTFVNRARVHPGQVRVLQINDIIQIGTVQMKVVLV